MIRLGIAGIHGRMGQEIVRLANSDSGFEVILGLVGKDRPTHQSGTPAIVHNLEQSPSNPDVLLIFSPEVVSHARAAAERGIGLVVGTTGLPDSDVRQLQELSRQVPVWFARNMSFGVNLIHDLIRSVASQLPDADVEIVETHHRGKVDAPSGTALDLAETIRSARESGVITAGRAGYAPRASGEIGVHSVRSGVVTGEHEIIFATDEEEIRITHRALNRAVFARGALKAAATISGSAPGWYGPRVLISA